MTPRPLMALPILAVCLSSIGCGDDWKANTFPATGRVTVNGMVPEGARVHLHPVNGKVDQRNSSPWGIVQKDGTFTLSTYETGDGAPPGEYVITLRWPFEPDQADLGDRLNYAFMKPEKSQWRVTITDGENPIPPIEITGAVVAKQRPGKSAGPAGEPSNGKSVGR